jgi:hypothetical protein
VSDERAIDAFIVGIHRRDLIEELGRSNPRTVARANTLPEDNAF